MRSALSKGDIPQREAMAEQFILPRAGEWGIDARRLHGALIAQNPRIIDSTELSDGMGDVLRRLTYGASGMSSTTVEQKIVMIQRQRLPAAHQTFRTLLAAASAGGKAIHLNVESILWIYLQWDREGPQYPKRREILRHYYREEARKSNVSDQLQNPTEKDG